MKQTCPYCLASASPRRKELLERFGFRFEVLPTHVDESALPGERPEELVARLARLTAQAVGGLPPQALAIAGDTLVVLGGDVLGKPRGRDDAVRMLSALSGQEHRVLSGYHLQQGPGGEAVNRTVETRVRFRELPEEWIAWYADLPETMDKAGAYAIQGMGGLLVSGIEGSYTNVVGFPVEQVVWDLIRQGWAAL